MVGYSVPPFFSGVFVIVLFSVQLGWLPSVYDTLHEVVDWETFKFQFRQMIMPVMVLALQTTAQISRFMRSSMLDNLNQDYVRTARAKGLSEWTVVAIHVLRNSMIPVVTVIALGIPSIFGGAIITDGGGEVSGLFALPNPNTSGNPKFKTGERLFRLTSSSSNVISPEPETFAQALFSSTGILRIFIA